MTRFENRFIVVTETTHIVKKSTFSYKSFADKRDAMSAVDKINAKGSFYKRAYVVDQNNMENIILP